jgi:hypothetical protein
MGLILSLSFIAVLAIGFIMGVCWEQATGGPDDTGTETVKGRGEITC